MNMFIFYSLCAYILTAPFYLFSSGLPQPADFIIFIGFICVAFTAKMRAIYKLKITRVLVSLTVLIFLINSSYSLYYYGFEGVENTMFANSFYYIFNFCFFCFTLYALKDHILVYANRLSTIIIISLIIQSTLAVLGIHKGSLEPGSRAVIFFNNPNQLGYYVLLLFTIFTILPSTIKKNKLILFLVIFLSSYLILYSGSRAALAGTLFLGGVIFFEESFKFKASSIFLVLTVLIAVPIILSQQFVQDKIEAIEARNIRNRSYDASELEIRGYDRLINHPFYIITGAGEGLTTRFKSFHNLEIHSSFATILFSYGLLGFYFFIKFILRSIQFRKKYYALILIPIFLYNLTHQGLRTSLLWSLFAILFLVTNFLLERKNSKSLYETS